MIFRKKSDIELWASCHPDSTPCVDDNEQGQCPCTYHVVNNSTKEVFPFDDWKLADIKYCSLSGDTPFNILNPSA